MENLLERFIRYAKIDTESSVTSSEVPSTPTQLEFFKLLVGELRAMGIEDVKSSNGYVMATIPANTSKKNVPAIGFIAHVDTSPDLTGKGVNPQVIEPYSGGDIVLNSQVTMKVDEFPQLNNYIGHTLVTTDGNTLLGADDKAGVAEIMCAAEYIMNNSNFEHGEIKLGFTPDEEIGRGVDNFDVELFGAKYAYTMDGSSLGELEYENFNAAMATITIQGLSVHPGYAKGKMINSFTVAREIDNMLPKHERPEFTEGREGFYHQLSVGGSVDSCKVIYIIRDHSMELFNERKAKMECVINTINTLYGKEVAQLEMVDQYYNMEEIVSQHPDVINVAIKAMERLNITPKVHPIRGGTDGSRLSFMGLPCPNVFAGGENFHGRYEFASVETMTAAKDVILEIVKVWNERGA